jgi:hypothetical protein
MATEDRLSKVNLSLYRPSILWRLVKLLESALHSFDAAATQKVLTVLRTHNFIRRPPTLAAYKSLTPIIVEWKGRGMRQIALKQILDSPQMTSVFPVEWPQIVVSNKLPKSIASLVFNFALVSRTMSINPAIVCPCQTLFPTKFRTFHNHVYTGDLNIVAVTSLRKILAYGSNFRTAVLQPDLGAAIEEGLNTFINSTASTKGMDVCQFSEWKTKVLSAVRTRASQHTSPGVTFSKSALKNLKFLQEYLVLAPTDKASSNISFTCKRLYVSEILSNEFEQSGAYRASPHATLERITNRHEQRLSTDNLGLFYTHKLGFLYAMPKFHKQTVKQRFIASLKNCSTTL